MKSIITLLLFTSTILPSTQTTTYSGEYTKKTKTKKGEILEWTLSLRDDGTFLYHFYRDLNCHQCVEEHFYGKGTWTASKKVIIFNTRETDIDINHTINLNKSKARVYIKSLKNKSKKDHTPSIRFYTSETSSIKGLQLYLEE
ncbi:hypothetical protein [uncultured Dokdonia sp.]|uniref:hypothetical protein n=1 Tax=uncultured Dokdonia sp. TaxID=575653 RepID=UPI00262F2266|nr:hypothetical protein [uncultured Dokdonia sp.]